MNRLIALSFTLMLSASAYAMPPEIEADRLILQGSKELKDQEKKPLGDRDYEIAVTSFEKAEKLNVKMPETFYYHFGKAYTGAKKWSKARAAYEKYLDQTGTRGKFYREALEGFNQADLEATKIEKANAKVRASYMEAKERYESDMRGCSDEFDKYRASLEADKERAWKKCHNYGKYDCLNYPDSSAKAVLEAAEAASSRLDDLGYSSTKWCNNRYTAPRKPVELN